MFISLSLCSHVLFLASLVDSTLKPISYRFSALSDPSSKVKTSGILSITAPQNYTITIHSRFNVDKIPGGDL